MKYFLFVGIFIYLASITQINAFVSQIWRRPKRRELKDEKFLRWVREITGLDIKSIWIFEMDKPLGMMPGVSWWPKMILSSRLYETFNKHEMEYVILHEAGHCLRWHMVKMGGVFLLMLVSGLSLVSLTQSWVVVIVLAVGFALLTVQINRWFEREAEEYAAEHLSDPKFMIEAVAKFRKSYEKPGLYWLIRKYFLGPNITYGEKIAIAEGAMKRRR